MLSRRGARAARGCAGEFEVEASWGGVFEVEVPGGTLPGSTLFIEVPRAPQTPKPLGMPGAPAAAPAASFSLHV